MDSSVKNTMYVPKDRLIMIFKDYKSVLYLIDVAEQDKTNTSSDIDYSYLPSYSLLQIVEANKRKYTKKGSQKYWEREDIDEASMHSWCNYKRRTSWWRHNDGDEISTANYTDDPKKNYP